MIATLKTARLPACRVIKSILIRPVLSAGRCVGILNGSIAARGFSIRSSGWATRVPENFAESTGKKRWISWRPGCKADPAAVWRRVDLALFLCRQYGGGEPIRRLPLFHRLGTSRLDQTICSAAAGAGWQKQCGELPGCPPENAADAELIVAWGINIKVTNVHFWQYVTAARKKGGRLLVIDPYRNQTGKVGG